MSVCFYLYLCLCFYFTHTRTHTHTHTHTHTVRGLAIRRISCSCNGPFNYVLSLAISRGISFCHVTAFRLLTHLNYIAPLISVQLQPRWQRETGRQTERDREIGRDREKERKKERKKEKERDRERQRDQKRAGDREEPSDVCIIHVAAASADVA